MHPGPGYDLLLALAVVAAFYFALRDAESRQLDGDKVFRAGVVMALVGYLGARLYVVLSNPEPYVRQPLDVVRVWEGGTASTGMYGGVMVGAVAAARWQRLPLAKLLDCAAPSAAAGIVFGRLGCFMNGCCFGEVTSLPWGVRFPVGSGAQMAQMNAGLIGSGQFPEPVHPVQLYESAFALLLFLFVWRYRRAQRRDGDLAALFLLVYGVGRFFVEFLRGDPRAHIGVLSLPQFFWMLAALSATAYLLRARLRGAPAP